MDRFLPDKKKKKNLFKFVYLLCLSCIVQARYVDNYYVPILLARLYNVHEELVLYKNMSYNMFMYREAVMSLDTL